MRITIEIDGVRADAVRLSTSMGEASAPTPGSPGEAVIGASSAGAAPAAFGEAGPVAATLPALAGTPVAATDAPAGVAAVDAISAGAAPGTT